MKTGTLTESIKNGQAYREPWSFFDGEYYFNGMVGYAIRGPEAPLDTAQPYRVYFEEMVGSPITLYGGEGKFVPFDTDADLVVR